MPRYQDPKEAARLMRAAGAIPLEPYKGSQIKWKCRCKKCKEVIFPTFAPVKNAGVNPCKKCSYLETGARRRAKSEAANIVILKKAKLNPLEPFPGNSKPWKVRCTKCKKVSSPHLSSIKNGSACVYCAGVRLDEKDVRMIYKTAGFEPIGKYPGKSKTLWKAKHKKCGVISSPSFEAIKRGSGCRTCSGTLKVSAKQAHSLFIKNHLEPVEPYVDTMKPWKSKCLKCKKVVSPNYNKVRLRGHQCKYCSGVVVDPAEAKKLMETAGFKTLVPYPGGNNPWKSQCLKCKKIFTPQFTSIKLGFGCKYCSHRAVDPKDAIASMKLRGLKVLEDFPGATKPWLVECINCKKTFKAKFHSLNTNNGCKYCSGVAVDETDLLAKLKELKLKPLEKYKSAKSPWKCKCLVCNHIVQPTWSRINAGRGHCAYCAQRRVDIPEALKFMKSLKLKPLADFPGNNKRWKCKCLQCGLEANPRWSDLRQGQGGCSNCADYGLNYQKPGYLYLITNEKLHSHKIGIANNYKSRKVDDRMYKHQKQGWTLFKKENFNSVQEAADIEAGILKWLRMEVGLKMHLVSKQMPQGGWTETVDASEIDLPSIWAKVKELSRVKR